MPDAPTHCEQLTQQIEGERELMERLLGATAEPPGTGKLAPHEPA